jgi:hypothetical protein
VCLIRPSSTTDASKNEPTIRVSKAGTQCAVIVVIAMNAVCSECSDVVVGVGRSDRGQAKQMTDP